MPFDGAGFPEWRDPPRRPASGDHVAIVIIVAVAFVLLVVPISLGAFADIVRYAWGR